VIGRALRRYSYDLNQDGLFDVEYADVFGIPFDFTAKPVVAKSKPPKRTVNVKAVRPERDDLTIYYPNVQGYRVELPDTRLTAQFTQDSTLELNPDRVGATQTQNSGIIGESVDLNVKHLESIRESTVLYELTKHLIYNKYRDPGEEPKIHLFGQLKRIARQWMKECLVCKGDTYPAQLMYREIADMACDRIKAAITEATIGTKPIKAILDAYNPMGSSAAVNFNTSKETLWQTDRRLSHVNWVVCDSDWEAEFCRVAEANPRVKAYVKNQGLGFEVPYLFGSTPRKYIPDFIVLVDDGHGPDDLLNLVVEIKGYRGEDAKDKANTMRNYWVPGVNNLGRFGRWQFAELTSVFEMDAEFSQVIETAIQVHYAKVAPPRTPKSPKQVESIKHGDDKRKNIPTAEHQSVMADEERSPIRVAYERRNPDLDEPQLVWRGKDMADWSDLVVSAPPLYIQEKVHPKVLVDDLLKQSQARAEATQPQQLDFDLFADFDGLPDATATDFYKHNANWSNRMILGDSLQVMASLAEREGLRGKVQCIYLDPPYGIKFGSNWQVSTRKRDVKDGKLEETTRQPEQIRAFRDSWELGIHSYLSYLRDRLMVARELLTETGSCFV